MKQGCGLRMHRWGRMETADIVSPRSYVICICNSICLVYAGVCVLVTVTPKSRPLKCFRALLYARVSKALFEVHSGKNATFYRWALVF